MKQFTLLILSTLCIWIATSTQVQSQTFDESSFVFNAGIGLGGYDAYMDFGVNASLEKGLMATGDFGVIGLGGFAGFATGSVLGFSATSIGVGVRGTYHFTVIPVENLDVYAGLQPTLVFRSYENDFIDNDTDFRPGFIAAARYAFSDSFSGYAEFQTAMTYLNVGISLSF